MGYLINTNINIVQGAIDYNLYNNCDAIPINIFDTNVAAMPLFMTLYFTNVNVDYEYNVATSRIILKNNLLGNDLIFGIMQASTRSVENSIVMLNLYRENTTALKYSAGIWQLYLNLPLNVPGESDIKYTLGYVYL